MRIAMVLTGRVDQVIHGPLSKQEKGRGKPCAPTTQNPKPPSPLYFAPQDAMIFNKVLKGGHYCSPTSALRVKMFVSSVEAWPGNRCGGGGWGAHFTFPHGLGVGGGGWVSGDQWVGWWRSSIKIAPPSPVCFLFFVICSA